MTEQGWTWSQEKSIPSDPAAGKEVIDQLLAKLEELQWVENDIFGVHLAVEEAMVNAIKHGNRNDPNKKVHIVCNTSPTRLRVQITDEGEGFSPEEVPDPTADENLELPSGRGLMLMRSFMSRVEFNEKGNSVVLEKHRNDAQ